MLERLSVLRDPARLFTDYAVIPPSYIIFKCNPYILAKNGLTGQIEFSGVNASNVIQSAIDALENKGGKIIIKSGYYPIKTPIQMRDAIVIQGEGRHHSLGTVLEQASDLDPAMFMFDNVLECGLIAMHLRSFKGKFTKGKALDINVPYGQYRGDLVYTLEDLFICDFPETGIDIRGDSRVVQMKNVVVGGCGGDGISIEGGDHDFVNVTASGNAYSGFAISCGNSLIIGKATGNMNGFDLYYGANGNLIIADAYENSKVGLLIEERPTGYPANRNFIYINAVTNERNIRITGGENNVIIGYAVRFKPEWNTYGVVIEGGTDNVLDVEAYWNNLGDWIFTAGTYFLKGVRGLKTSGVATLPAGSTSVTVAHGLVTTPKVVKVTPRDTAVGACAVTARDATNFTIEVSTAPTVDVEIDWEAEV